MSAEVEAPRVVLRQLIESSEEEILSRVLAYARRQDYTRYTSTLAEAWRASIAGLSAALCNALTVSSCIPELTPDEDYAQDPMAAFGIVEARKHRARGIDLPMFLGLMKYYEQGYFDVIEDAPFDDESKEWALLFTHRFFDRVELGFSSEWARCSEEQRVLELQDANRRLANEKNRYQTVFESLALPLFLVDPQGCVRNMNHAAARLLDPAAVPGAFYYDPGSDAVSLPWLAADLVLFDAQGRDEAVFDRDLSFAGITRRYEVHLRRMLDVSGKFDGITIVLEDVTDRVRAQNELRDERLILERCVADRTRQLDDALASLRDELRNRSRAEGERRKIEERLRQAQKLESLGVLAGGIAHDFNNLLTAILGSLELLEARSPGGPPQPLRTAQLATRRAAELCRQMLNYSGHGRFALGEVDLATLVGEMQPLLGVAARRNVALVCELGPARACADATQLRQVLMNLVTNAAEAIAGSAGKVTVRTGTAACDRACLDAAELGSALAPGLYAFLEVTDDGGGMAPETIARIFDPFYTTKFTGRGLGLATVLGVVRGHGGAIAIESAPGTGSRFRVLLPAIEPGSATVPGADEEDTGPLDIPPLSRLVRGIALVVDDEPEVRSVARALLQREGMASVEAADGLCALDELRRAGETVGLVLLDLTMPRMDGLATLAVIRRTHPELPVVLASGFDSVEVAGRLPKGPFVTVLQKPFDSAQLRAAVRRILP